ncbi:hypothetical protein FOPG_00081 [Fusarium oxysporum f. sp. conglutinans race 2 54008]|uniref:Uncharacterized protein n=1 Tax=Fusarium oxysporum f. sp. conglutinans race 2 54008 TaxID=1089457 RepID=X0JWX6_FUSOX|nr:hypothetical protein FOPG_00081 [Fusarium oxysporum f. sp. conglutinans race 2 54008]
MPAQRPSQLPPCPGPPPNRPLPALPKRVNQHLSGVSASSPGSRNHQYMTPTGRLLAPALLVVGYTMAKDKVRPALATSRAAYAHANYD